MRKPVRVGLISTSWFAEMSLIPNTQSHPNAKLISFLVDRRKGLKKSLKNMKLLKSIRITES